MPTDKVNSSRDREVGECPALQSIKQRFANIWKYVKVSWGLNSADFRVGSKPRNHQATSQASQTCIDTACPSLVMQSQPYVAHLHGGRIVFWAHMHTHEHTHTHMFVPYCSTCITVLLDFHSLWSLHIFHMLWNLGAGLLCDFSRKLLGNKHIVFPLISNLTLILTHSFLFYHLSVALFRLSQIHNISACASKYVYT